MTMTKEITIKTLECDVCNRFDSIKLSKEEILERSKITNMGIGAYSIEHKDHTRIIYFDKEGIYLGDTIAINGIKIDERIVKLVIINKDQYFIYFIMTGKTETQIRLLIDEFKQKFDTDDKYVSYDYDIENKIGKLMKIETISITS